MDTFVFQPRPVYRRRARIERNSATPPPPSPAVVIAAVVPGGIGMVVTLQFDRPLVLIGPPPYPLSGEIQVNDANPINVDLWAPDLLAMEFDVEMMPGATWNVNATPAWCATPLQVSGGTVG